MDKKAGSMPITLIATVVIVLAVVVILLFATGTAQKWISQFKGTAPSDESLWKQACDNACNNAKMQANDCDVEYKSLYCDQSYNSTMNCGQAENMGVIAKCAYTINKETCGCA